MGQILARGLGALDDMDVVALVDPHEPSELFGAQYRAAVEGLAASDVDVVVDFSEAESVVRSARWCAAHGVALVVGTTGLRADHRAELAAAGERTGVVVAANFAIGAVLAERFAAWAAPYFERAEVIELHHDAKVDAPSGTSIATAHAIAAARREAGRGPIVDTTTTWTLANSRGADAGDGVRVHSVRLPGLVAHQEILFGGPGEGLVIRHDSYDRASFVPGVALAIRTMDRGAGLVEGLAALLA
jgi:4-hydroxy-tetrahydrodipicolinate reductase